MDLINCFFGALEIETAEPIGYFDSFIYNVSIRNSNSAHTNTWVCFKLTLVPYAKYKKGPFGEISDLN